MNTQIMHTEAEYSALLKKTSIFCSKRERSELEVRNKIIALNGEGFTEEIIAVLKKEKLLDEARFVQNFISDKITISHWGKLKIKQALINHNIEDKVINGALKSIPDDEYRHILKQLIEKAGKPDNIFGMMIHKGFEEEVITDVVKELGNINK